jgi:stage IV sporulation protein FB
VFIAAGSEAGMAQMRGILFNVPARELMISEFRSLAPDARVSDAADALIRTSQTEFPIVDASGKLLGLLDRNGIIKALAERGPDARATETMRTDVPSVSERQRLHDGLELLQGRASAIGVTGDEGQLVGLITMENLLEKVMIVRASERRGGQKPEVSVPHARA